MVYRARIALGDSEEVLAEVEGEDTPDYAAVKALAQYKMGDVDQAVEEIEALASTDADNATVQVIGGGILLSAGRSEEALSLLSHHQGSLEAYVQNPPLPVFLVVIGQTFTRKKSPGYMAYQLTREFPKQCRTYCPTSTFTEQNRLSAQRSTAGQTMGE